MSFLNTDPIYHWDVKQNTPEWDALRFRRITSSAMDVIITGKGEPSKAQAVRNLAIGLCMEIKGGESDEKPFFGDYWTKRGNELESEARDAFIFDSGLVVKEIGFISRGLFGCSPDGMVVEGEKLLSDLEIKCLGQKNHGIVSQYGPEKKHLLQMHSRMVISGLNECHYWGYHPNHEDNRLLIKRDEFTDKVETAMLAFEELVMETAEKLNVTIN